VTGGNPFLVCEAIEAGWPAIPPTVRDVVGARLARSSVPVRDALQAAAVIGTSIDRDLLATLTDGSAALLDDCVRTGLLTGDASSLRFRHELVRMAIEQAIPPHRKVELHALLLAALQDTSNADPAVLAHHAEGAGDAAAIRRHALTAARRSAELGAHREAGAQYERALRYADAADQQVLAELHEGIATEYLLLDRVEESEAALRAALRCRRELGDDLRAGEDLGALSDVLFYQCRGEEGAQAAEDSLAVLQSLPAGPELAGAYLGVAGNRWDAGQQAEAFGYIAMALELGDRLGRLDIVSSALSMKARVLVDSGQDGIGSFEEALRIALEAGAEGRTCSAYMCLQDACVSVQRLEEAERYFSAGMAIGERRELRSMTRCMRVAHADTLLLLGRWDEAAEVCAEILAIPGVSPWNLIYPQRILGTIRGRRGQPGHMELVDRSAALAAGIGSPPWLAQVRAIRAELLWLSGRPDLALNEAQEAFDQALGRTDLWKLGSLAIWVTRLGAAASLPLSLPEPYALEIAGDWRGAAVGWERLGRTYDAALTRIVNSTDDTELRGTLVVLDDLGADATAAAARRRMRELGMTAIPRRPRTATRATPAGLTAREQQVLSLLSEGLSDKEISERLVISERTVHHHVSSILAKIGVASRLAAVLESARTGVGTPT
jgi:DNA-binding CsgD family transcriptional regulator/tetratricopeptide (TPR) repeat protein